jgi:putative flippase GtrA
MEALFANTFGKRDLWVFRASNNRGQAILFKLIKLNIECIVQKEMQSMCVGVNGAKRG